MGKDETIVAFFSKIAQTRDHLMMQEHPALNIILYLIRLGGLVFTRELVPKVLILCISYEIRIRVEIDNEQFNCNCSRIHESMSE
jgi:hypothetical protein